MTAQSDLDLIVKMQRAMQAVETLAEEAKRIASEHDHALLACRSELCAIDDLVRPIVGDAPNGSLDLVRALIAELSASREAHALALQEVSRLTEADKQLREAHAKVVADRDHQWRAWDAAMKREHEEIERRQQAEAAAAKAEAEIDAVYDYCEGDGHQGTPLEAVKFTMRKRYGASP